MGEKWVLNPEDRDRQSLTAEVERKYGRLYNPYPEAPYRTTLVVGQACQTPDGKGVVLWINGADDGTTMGVQLENGVTGWYWGEDVFGLDFLDVVESHVS